MAFEVEITNASDVLAVTDEIGRQLRNGKIPSVTIKVPRDQKTANQRGYFFGGIIATALRHEIFESVTQDELVDAIIELESTEHIIIGGRITIPRRKRISARDSDSLIIIPGSSRDLHDSGYRTMDFVAIKDNLPVCLLAGGSDVIHIDGIGGFGKWKPETGLPELIKPSGWSIDCLPKSGLLRMWPSSHNMTCGEALSSFEIYALPKKEK